MSRNFIDKWTFGVVRQEEFPLITFRITSRFFMYLLPLIFVVATLVACEKTSDPTQLHSPVLQKAPLAKAERIDQVSGILKQDTELPSQIIDAYFDEVAVREGEIFDQVDFASYMYIKVALADIDKWRAVLPRTLGYTPVFKAPTKSYFWWIDSSRFKSMEFFQPQPLSTRNGWVAVSRQTGEIWIYGFTL